MGGGIKKSRRLGCSTLSFISCYCRARIQKENISEDRAVIL